ncbi:hypothetical protein [Methylomonas sp. DH-1]|uniref:hypothetical protein n=1 Tax=Methylomonas sp. (strain DH-1) TaxID=1727196 RepID=UPI0007C93E37|nr:hypothetical protein [Methylomonas sp. DH-1]ANE55995.1 hypothetical protein AYM39_12950 [Methylomonas sp. DH-1]
MYQDPPTPETEPGKRYVVIEQTVFILLVLLSLAGIYITDFNPDDGYGYWLAMVFVFGLLSVFVAWLQAKSGDADFGRVLKAQAMHWLHTVVVVIAASFLNKSGQLSGVSADLMILLILGLAAMLDGYHVGWEFSFLGFFLVGCAVIIGYVQSFLWACAAFAAAIVAVSLICTFLRSKVRSLDGDET